MSDDIKHLYEDWQQELYYIESYTEYLREIKTQETLREETLREETNEQDTCIR